MVENSTAGLVMVAGEVTVTVTREEQHQNTLARYAPAPGRERRVAVELAWCVVTAGKYKGQRAIEVRLDGGRVGELTYLMSQRYAPVVTNVNVHGGRAGCEAVIERDARGLQLTLRLPRDTNAVPAAATTGEPPTVVIPAVVPAAASASASTFTQHRKAWIVAGVVAAVLFFAAIANGDEDPAASPPPAEETTTTVTDLPTSTTTTTTTPPPTTTTTTTVAQPPPPPPTTEQPAPPPPLADPAPQQECDPNYSGCVPIASDVDCAGGSGNGPEYAEGPIQVIGEDIYDLDRDGNGTACE
jgi:hypothetical protein